ncbi:hypothetical protein TanjilG_05072 [Lupinus angustifolius]|uniref:Uncharacterized protein n=1 Tax=Lupinus angustifolius TaxID=3871 RepID=A0A4P1R582_LUPAN|nr:hypothetical protein TanjilG_05072 [Lupinus angustifolius]
MIMSIWHYVHKEIYMFELNNKVSLDYLTELTNNPNCKKIKEMKKILLKSYTLQ